MRLRRQNHISAAPSAIPTIGPITTPKIQVLRADDELGAAAWFVYCGAVELDELILAGAIVRLENVEWVELGPANALDTKLFGLHSFESYYLAGLHLH